MNTQATEMTEISPHHTASTWAAEADPYSPGPRGHDTRPVGGRNSLAGAAVVLGVIALSTSIVFVGGPLGVIGLILGIAALPTTKRTGIGRSKAITAVVTSALAIVVSILVAVFTVWYANTTQECYQPDSFQQYKQCVHEQFTGN